MHTSRLSSTTWSPTSKRKMRLIKRSTQQNLTRERASSRLKLNRLLRISSLAWRVGLRHWTRKSKNSLKIPPQWSLRSSLLPKSRQRKPKNLKSTQSTATWVSPQFLLEPLLPLPTSTRRVNRRLLRACSHSTSTKSLSSSELKSKTKHRSAFVSIFFHLIAFLSWPKFKISDVWRGTLITFFDLW